MIPRVSKTKRKYTCTWCGFKFEQDVGTSNVGKPKVSSHVVCPKCSRTIETFPKEYTENIVGRKHIHKK